MRITFRQGLVKIPKDALGIQTFLQKVSNGVNLSVTNGNVTVTIANQQANYLHTEHHSTIRAWDELFTVGVDYWLYWDINTRSGIRTFGSTTLEPLVQSTQPVNPALGQMWFDIPTNTMKEYTGVWRIVIRCVAAKLESGTIIESWNGGNTYEGSQVGDNTINDVGSIIFDSTDSPLRRNNNTFFTTTDAITTGIDVVSSINLDALHFQAEASTTMSAFTVVYLNEFGMIKPARFSSISNTVFGLIQDNVLAGQITTIVTSGVITNINWNWPTVNALLYYDDNGSLTTDNRPGIQPIGYVVEPTKVILKSFNTSFGTNMAVQGYPMAVGNIDVNTSIHWHTIEQDGVVELNFDTPTGNIVSEFVIEIIGNGQDVIWPEGSETVIVELGHVRIFYITYRPSINGIDATFIRTESMLY